MISPQQAEEPGALESRSGARKELVCCLPLSRKPADADSVVTGDGSLTDDLQLGNTRRGNSSTRRAGEGNAHAPHHCEPYILQWQCHAMVFAPGGLRAHTAGNFRRLACSNSAGQHGYRNDPFGDARQEIWFYYAAMATAGSVLGGFLAYRLARKGRKEALDKKLRAENVQKFYERFERGILDCGSPPSKTSVHRFEG